jgi:hypothetical protein
VHQRLARLLELRAACEGGWEEEVGGGGELVIQVEHHVGGLQVLARAAHCTGGRSRIGWCTQQIFVLTKLCDGARHHQHASRDDRTQQHAWHLTLRRLRGAKERCRQ